MKKKRYIISSYNTNKYFQQQGTATSLPVRIDQVSDTSSSSMEHSNGYSQMSTLDDSQAFNVGGEYQYSEPYSITPTTATNNNNNNNTIVDNEIQSWDQLYGGGEKPIMNNTYADVPQVDAIVVNQPIPYGSQSPRDSFQFSQESVTDNFAPEADYETIIRTKNLYYDPQPQVIRKASKPNSIVYNQNIMVRFLQPPPVPQGPLIIREVRPPQLPPPPPLVIRQHPPPPLSPPPIILRERPPPIPACMTAKVITKTLPPIPPPPRSVIIENLPRLPAKPRDVIIERWIPYEAMYKRPIVVHRAKETKPYPQPKNIIITYEPVQSRIVRQFQRLGVTPEDPTNYSKNYGNSLLDTDQLLAQIKELGITVDMSPPPVFNNESQPLLNDQDHNFNMNTNTNNNNNTSPQRYLYREVPFNYAPTYENLVNGSSLTRNYEESIVQQVGLDNKFFSNHGEDLSTQLAHYGITAESIPY